MTGSVLVIALGEIAASEVVAAVRRHFGSVKLAWLDRRDLRRAPLRTLAQLLGERHDAAVLVAPELGQPRLRLTSVLLGLPRAATRWRIDVHGNCQAWDPRSHLERNGLPIVRHLAACGLAFAFGVPLLRVLDRFIIPREQPRGRRPDGSVLRQSRGEHRWHCPSDDNSPHQPPQRVLYLRSQLWLGLTAGGSVAHTSGVIRGLEQAGIQVDVVSSDRLPGVRAQTTLVPPETWFDGWLREVEDLAYNVAFFVAAVRVARRAHPQAFYQRHTAFNCAGALLSRLFRLPLVLEFNSSELWKGRYWGGLHLRGAAALVERVNLRAADVVVVISKTLRQQVEAAGVPRHKILVNPNGVDPAQFRPEIDASGVRQQLGLDASNVVVGFSGTFGEWHGIPTLAQALPRVLEARPAARWLLVGDGPLRWLVDAAVATHGLGERVYLPGLVAHAAMPAYLAACDVLVSPHGRQADGGEFFGSPTKLFEYMAAGKPIVASAVGQIAEVLTDERSALLVPPDDPQALCSAILRLVDDAGLRARLGQAAREAAVERHTWRQNAERLLEALAHHTGSASLPGSRRT